jgi:hypothetical protein
VREAVEQPLAGPAIQEGWSALVDQRQKRGWKRTSISESFRLGSQQDHRISPPIAHRNDQIHISTGAATMRLRISTNTLFSSPAREPGECPDARSVGRFGSFRPIGQALLLALAAIVMYCSIASAASAFTISGTVTAQTTGTGVAETEVSIAEASTEKVLETTRSKNTPATDDYAYE